MSHRKKTHLYYPWNSCYLRMRLVTRMLWPYCSYYQFALLWPSSSSTSTVS
ncbi:unnamed protein product [Plutella xylostella]|uniref:(diamondback moth) hypothetical protein n=1 Tax=Plutella xylostella TaxID=51655 RepID=A0A8S4FSH6_PLUXY|nr:unnamed protein product [Plutella xylostella]